MPSQKISTLFVDIGGVLLTNGWDRFARKRAAEAFKLDYDKMNERHHLTFDTYEVGKLSLDEYLDRVVFHEPRGFTPDDFKTFMFAQSQPYPDMIALIRILKERHRLQVATVSNEGRELTEYRIRTFGLGCFVDFFVSSCFVHFRKPDEDIFRVALDIAQAQVEEVIYIDDRELFVEVAAKMGFHAIIHRDYESTRAALTSAL
ncbi:MAG: HAD-IA family hydrolase [Armatimonadetes bacterium]|nr:HAD-IA family hydrolase [Armatimonadota bacterium]